MKLYWVSSIIQDKGDNKPWLCASSESELSLEDAINTIAKARTNKKIDQTFIKFLPWMLNKIPKDEQVLERFISEAQTIYKNWDVETFNFADDVVRNITINPSENLRQVCPHCGEEVISNVRFPNGIRALFKTETKHAKFGSR